MVSAALGRLLLDQMSRLLGMDRSGGARGDEPGLDSRLPGGSEGVEVGIRGTVHAAREELWDRSTVGEWCYQELRTVDRVRQLGDVAAEM